MKKHPKKSMLIFAGLCALCVVALIFQLLCPQGTVAVIERNGEIVLRRELSTLEEPNLIEVTGENGIVLQIELTESTAAVVSSQCPDKICVHTGTLTKAGQSAICLPAKVVLRLESGTAGVDGVT